MAFVKFATPITDFYFPECRVVELAVTASDKPERSFNMTVATIVKEDNLVEEYKFYCEPVFV